jgi:uncharacterized CHY-type Zn-finger protein
MAKRKPQTDKFCAAGNCDDHILVGRGLCGKHWQQFRLAGTLESFPLLTRGKSRILGEDKIRCGKCKRDLAPICYQKNATPEYPDRLKSICRECVKSNGLALKEARKSGGICIYCDRPKVDKASVCEFHRRERMRWRSTLESRVNELVYSSKDRSEKNGLICDIDAEWVKEKLSGKCELTGMPFDFESGKKMGRFNPFSPSIDRIIPGSHYTKENCRMILTALNVGINFWGEAIYREIAKAYLRQYRAKNKSRNDKTFVNQTHNLLLENPQSIRTRKH